MSLPSVQDVRKRIESVKRKDICYLLKAIYLLGAARIAEMAGELCPRDSVAVGRRQIVYGPKGTDVSLSEFQVEELSISTAIQVLHGSLSMEEAFPKVKVALFRIKIAKQHLAKGETPRSRLVALPLDKKYEPWTNDLFNFFKKANSAYVFPFTRQEAWAHITYEEPIFKGLTYPIEKYEIKKDGVVIASALLHDKPFKLHGLRHLRTKELFEVFQFDGLDFAAYIGWSIRTARSLDVNIPQQLPRYATVYENWRRYFPKLLRAKVT